MSVQVRWFTDPACSWSWGTEPLLRRLLWEFEGELDFVWAMGGLARRYGSSYRDEEGAIGSGPDCFADLMSHWLNVAGRTGMPCDPRLWTANPIDSTFAACVAVEAASEQGWEAGYRDRPRFEATLDSPAAAEAFEAHREEAREVPEEARAEGKHSETEGRERVSFPSAVFTGADGERHGVWGWQPLERYREAALAAGAKQANAGPLPPAAAIERFGRMATREVEVLNEAPGPATCAELWRLAAEERLRPVRALTGTIWEVA